MKKIISLYALGMICFCPNNLYANMTVKSDQIRYNDHEKKTYATGHAVATLKKDTGDQVLNADKLIVYHGKNKEQAASEDIDRIDAYGQVIFTNENFTLTADQCIYKKTENEVICTGCIHVNNKNNSNQAIGEKAIIDLEKESYTIEGEEKKPAEALIELN